MSYGLLVKKLERMGGGYTSRKELTGYCKRLGLGYRPAISYLTSNRYAARILKGIFYVKTVEERKLNTVNVNHFEAIKEAMSMKSIHNWYFGLDTALSLNNKTHEYTPITYVLSDSISRPRPFEILGHKVKFIKISKRLFGFGVIDKNVPYSDIEKTLLDTVYLGRYNGLTEAEITANTADILEHCSKEKIESYKDNYPKTVRRFIEAMM